MQQFVIVLWTIFFTAALFGAESTPIVQSTIGVMAGAFGAGLLLTFTPCVLPMVPIVSSIIAGQGENLTKLRAFWLSLAYVLGTAATYTVMGALAGATGEQLQSYFQNVWAIGAMSLVFVLMALAMFGVYTIQLPAFLQSRLDAESRKLKGGSFVMVFALGAVSALILGACVSPVLISFLSVAIATQDAGLGAMTMFSLALGMGVPLIVVGVGAGSFIPKAGGWTNSVKYFFGVLLLAVAIYLFNELNLFSELITWGLFALVLGIYLDALEPLPQPAGGIAYLRKALGVVLLVWGVILLVGAAKGSEDMWQPLKSEPVVVAGGSRVSQTLPFELVSDMNAFEAAQQKAQKAGKALVVYFYSNTCSVCKKMKATTLKDRRVRKILNEKFVAVRVNITNHSDEKSMAIKRRFKVFGTPTMLFFGSHGELLKDETVYGYVSPEEFYDLLDILAE